MALLGPFEPQPRIAVGVSGGADSMALAWLAHRWVQACNGSIIALTVNHGLRPEAAVEATQVGQWLSNLHIPHEILVWEGPKPAAALQEEARQARYKLLDQACRRLGILHLLIAHTQDDQAETVLLRLAKGSSPLGLAGMAAERFLPHVRILRPLLSVSRDKVRETAKNASLPWVEDPSNVSPLFARPRLRAVQASLSAEGFTPQTLAMTAERAAEFREFFEAELAQALSLSVSIYPEGWATIDLTALRQMSPLLARHTLGRVIATIGGATYVPQQEYLNNIWDGLQQPSFSTRTLGGCLLTVRRGQLHIIRELASVANAQPFVFDQENIWDRRFSLQSSDLKAGAQFSSLHISALGQKGWAIIKDQIPKKLAPLPATVRWTLPALWADQTLMAVPHAAWQHPNMPFTISVSFNPFRPLL